jgi:hypothetical protein
VWFTITNLKEREKLSHKFKAEKMGLPAFQLVPVSAGY